MDNHEPKPVVTGYPAAAQPAAAAAAVGNAYPYPYPAPPYYAAQPPPPQHPYYDPSAAYNRGSSNSRFLRRLIIISITVLLLIGVVTIVPWLILRLHLPEFAVASASVSSFNLSSTRQLSSDFNLTMSVRNPNKKMGIYYDRVEAAVMYGSEPIWETSLPPFYQGKGNSTVLPARFGTIFDYVDPGVADGIAMDRAGGGGVVNFHVRLLAWVRFRAGGWRTRRHVMRVYCDDVRIRLSNAAAAAGSLVEPSRRCQVDL